MRKQLVQATSFRDLLQGAGVTVVRNAFLFGTFAVALDSLPYPNSLSSFWRGALSANLAWICVWPLDVCKSRRQSGLPQYRGMSAWQLFVDVIKTGAIFRGLGFGLIRSTIGNGCGMLVYTKWSAYLQQKRARD